MSVLSSVESPTGSSTEVASRSSDSHGPPAFAILRPCPPPGRRYWLNFPSDAFLGLHAGVLRVPESATVALAPSAAVGDRSKLAPAGGAAFCVLEVVVGATVEEPALATGTEEGGKNEDGSDTRCHPPKRSLPKTH